MLASAILRVRRRSCATWRRPAAIFCNARAAYYFYDIATPCNKREPGSGCSAVAGLIACTRSSHERGLHCDASLRHVRALAALDARSMWPARRAGRDRVFEFPSAAGKHAAARHDLQPNEIVTAIELPARGFAANYTY